jgi:hypothetical protein
MNESGREFFYEGSLLNEEGTPLLTTPEDPRIRIEEADFDTLRDFDINRDVQSPPEQVDLMKKYGINYDTGLIKVSVGGVNYLFVTNRDDFGTLSSPGDQVALEPEKYKAVRAEVKKLKGRVM